MKAEFWHERWQTNRIGFHNSQPNPLITNHFDELAIPQGGRVFVPLCGKTRDIAWLLANGYPVVGVELSPLAIDQLFDELGIHPTIENTGDLSHYIAPNLDIFVGDIFNLTPEILGTVDAIIDRAAMVALPPAIRTDYAAHLIHLTQRAPQLLITYAYDQSLRDGPPFSVQDEEVRRHYAAHYAITLIHEESLASNIKEKVWIVS